MPQSNLQPVSTFKNKNIKTIEINKTVNIALQVLPTSATIHPYILVDKAIEVITASGA